MDKIKELERQLAEAKREKQLHKEIREARCPVCGSELEFTAKNSWPWGIFREYNTVAEIRCPSCECFGKKATIRQGDYTGKRTKPSELLASVWAKISKYVVKQ